MVVHLVALRSCDFSCVLLISLVSCECSLHCRLGFQAHLERPRFQAHFEVTHVVPSCCSHLHYKLKRKKNMINLCTAVTQFSGVLYPCKHQAWPRDTQVNILVKWYPYDPSLPLRIHWLLSSSKKHHIQMQGSTNRLCFIHELLHIDGESSINVHIYLWASGRYTIYCGPTQITCRLGAPGTTLTFNKAQNMCTE